MAKKVAKKPSGKPPTKKQRATFQRSLRRVAAQAPPAVKPTVKPVADRSRDPYTQLREAGALDRRGRQQAGPPRKLSEKRRVVRTARGRVTTIPERRARLQEGRRILRTWGPDLNAGGFEAHADRAVRRADRRVRRAAMDPDLPPRVKDKALEELAHAQVRRIQERQITDDDTRERYGLERRDKDTKVLGVNVEAELEGRGGLAKGGKWFKEHVLPTESQSIRQGGVGEVSARLGREATDLATQAPASLYIVGAGAAEALQGRPERIGEVWEGYKEHGVLPALAAGKPGEALKRFSEAPIMGSLELSGAKAVAGRTAGATMRASGGRAAELASLERSQLHLYPRELRGGPRESRRYSKDIINKGLQVAAERLKGREIKVRGRVVKPARVPEVAYPRPRVRMQEPPVRRRLMRRVDTRAFTYEGIRRKKLGEVVRESARLAPPEELALIVKSGIPKKWAPAVYMVVEGTIRRPETFWADLGARLATLKRSYPDAKTVGKEVAAENLRNQERLQALLADKKNVDVEAIFESAEKWKGIANPQQPRLQALGKYTEGEHEARFLPFAQAHMGAQVRGRRGKADEAVEHRLVVPREGRIGMTETGAFDTVASLKALQRQAKRQSHARRKGWDLDYENGLGARRLGQAITNGRASEIRSFTMPPEHVAALESRLRTARLTQRRDNPDGSVTFERPGLPQALRSEPLLTGTKKARAQVAVGRAETRALPMAEIKATARREGVEPALITQRPISTRQAMYQPVLRGIGPPAPLKGKRSGTAYELGGSPITGDALLKQVAYSENLAVQGENLASFAQEFGIAPRADGGFETSYAQTLKTGEELVTDATGQLKPGHVPLMPMNIAELRTPGAKVKNAQEAMRPGAQAGQELSEQLAANVEAAFRAPTTDSGRFVLVPEDVVGRLLEHTAKQGAVARMAGPITNLWKDIVLTTTKPVNWILNNVGDLGMRSAFAGLFVTDVRLYNRVLADMAKTNPRRAMELDEAVTGGGLFHAASRTRQHRPTLMDTSKAGRAVAYPWRTWRDSVYFVERHIEKLPQAAAAGKAMRRDIEMKDSLQRFVRVTDEHVSRYAQNLAHDRGLEARLQKATEDVVGRWGKVSPTMRSALGLAPFAQWLAAAMRYVYITLPVHHPIKTALIVAAEKGTEEERTVLGLTRKTPHLKQVLEYQQGGAPLSGDRLLSLGRRFSFGTAGGIPGNIPEFVLPQANSVLLALRGISWTGEELVYPDDYEVEALRGQPLSQEDANKVALGLFIEGIIPFGIMFRRSVQEGGRPSDPTSTLIAPRTRPQYNPETQQYEEREGGLVQGVLDWIDPRGLQKRLTYGDIAEIEKAKRRGQTFQELRERNRGGSSSSGPSGPRLPENFGGGGGSKKLPF